MGIDLLKNTAPAKMNFNPLKTTRDGLGPLVGYVKVSGSYDNELALGIF